MVLQPLLTLSGVRCYALLTNQSHMADKITLTKKDKDDIKEMFSDHAGTIRDAVIAQTKASEKVILNRIDRLETGVLSKRIQALEKQMHRVQRKLEMRV